MTYDDFLNFLDDFEEIPSFAGRIRAVNQTLTRLGSGSGRVVYDIDGDKVLKVAKNTKGQAQNNDEVDVSAYQYNNDIVTKVLEYDTGNSGNWLVVEKAKKVNEKRIKELTGIPNLYSLDVYLRNFQAQNRGQSVGPFNITKEEKAVLDENEWVHRLQQFVADHDQNVMDMGRPSSYGEVMRNGRPTIVMTDYGLSEDTYQSHYNKSREGMKMYEMVDMNRGQIYQDFSDPSEVRNSMWALQPYSVDDGMDSINEEFINFVELRENFMIRRPIFNVSTLSEEFHNAVNRLPSYVKKSKNETKFVKNLISLQEYLTEMGSYKRDGVLLEEEPQLPQMQLSEEQATKVANFVAQQLQLSTPQLLKDGCGSYGCAYKVGDKVLKITTDPSEVVAAMKVQQAKPVTLAEIYNVWKVISNEANEYYYVILMEFIEDRPEQEFHRLTDIFGKIADASDRSIMVKRGGEPQRRVIDYVFTERYYMRDNFNYEDFVKDMEFLLTAAPDLDIDPDDRKRVYDFMIGIANIKKELNSLGLSKNKDFTNLTNLGYKDGILTHFDVGGVSKVTPPDIPDENTMEMDEAQERPMRRLDFVFNEILKIPVSDIAKFKNSNVYVDNKNRIDSYMKKNPHDAEFFYGLMDEDSSSKFSTDTSMGQDDFPVYNNVDTSPMTRNNLDANSAMYNEDLEYNHADDATQDEYMLTEREESIFFSVDKSVIPAVADYFTNRFTSADEEEELRVTKKLTKDFILNRVLEMEKQFETKEFEALHQNMLSTYKTIKQKGLDYGDGFSVPSSFDALQQMFYLPAGRVGMILKGETEEYGNNLLNRVYIDIQSMKGALEKFLKGGTNQRGTVYEERKKAWVPGSKAVTVKKKCRLGGLGNTSAACNTGDINNLEFTPLHERDKSYMPKSKAVTVKKKCRLGGLGNTSVACNQGDINNLEFSAIKENAEEEYDIVSDPIVNRFYNKLHKRGGLMSNPLGGGEFIYGGASNIKLSRFDMGDRDEIELDNIASFDKNQGTGTRVMNDVISVADEMGLRMKLHAKPFGHDGLELFRLIEFYKKFGFESDLTTFDGEFATEEEYLQYLREYPDEGMMMFREPNSKSRSLEEELQEMITQEVMNYFNVNESREMISEKDILTLQELPFKLEIERLGGKIYAVGGSVRDSYIGKASKDLDLVITGVPTDVLEKVLLKYGSAKHVGKAFGVYKFVPKGSVDEIDIALPRTEVSTGEGHKDFEITADHKIPLLQDLERRDFTMNAIAKDVNGTTIDPFNGLQDISNGIIRVVGNKSFADDPLRMLRAVQFASRFGFVIEPKSYEMLQQNADKINTIAPKRIEEEFDKIVSKGDALAGAKLLKESGLLAALVGHEGELFNGPAWNEVSTIAEFIYLMTFNMVQSPLAFAKDKITNEKKILDELEAIEGAMVNEKRTEDPVENRKLANEMYKKSSRSISSKILPRALQRAAEEFNTDRFPKTIKELEIDGNVLEQLGYAKKKGMEDVLEEILNEVYAENVRNNREELINLAQSKAGEYLEFYKD